MCAIRERVRHRLTPEISGNARFRFQRIGAVSAADRCRLGRASEEINIETYNMVNFFYTTVNCRIEPSIRTCELEASSQHEIQMGLRAAIGFQSRMFTTRRRIGGRWRAPPCAWPPAGIRQHRYYLRAAIRDGEGAIRSRSIALTPSDVHRHGCSILSRGQSATNNLGRPCATRLHRRALPEPSMYPAPAKLPGNGCIPPCRALLKQRRAPRPPSWRAPARRGAPDLGPGLTTCWGRSPTHFFPVFEPLGVSPKSPRLAVLPPVIDPWVSQPW